jgi:hypothetical protein
MQNGNMIPPGPSVTANSRKYPTAGYRQLRNWKTRSNPNKKIWYYIVISVLLYLPGNIIFVTNDFLLSMYKYSIKMRRVI